MLTTVKLQQQDNDLDRLKVDKKDLAELMNREKMRKTQLNNMADRLSLDSKSINYLSTKQRNSPTNLMADMFD